MPRLEQNLAKPFEHTVPPILRVERCANLLGIGTETLEMAVLELDARLADVDGGERDLNLGDQRWVVLPVGADLPCEHHA